jgi:hypothetical protein
MLKGTDFLWEKGLIRRDPKPTMIVHVTCHGRHHFQLGHLGFSHRASLAKPYPGSPIYLGPKFLDRGKQTHQVDAFVMERAEQVE